ncbi:MAG: lipoyl synthase [Candidatus Omnitrophica bacterium]|nr:lipoyl synthase [Candidatus Omnitrophota bacterium]
MKSKIPSWFRQDIPDASTFKLTHLVSEFGVNTVCKEAMCPNMSYCFKHNKITFMILGSTCTRNCSFCNVDKTKEVKMGFDSDEPFRIAEVVRALGLSYVVITSVTRDDLSDGGAWVFAKTIEAIRQVSQEIKVEVLIPDFKGKVASLKCVLNAYPNILAHNIETIRRLYPKLRPMSDYELSLGILSKSKEINPDILTKSSIMLGLGETEEEVVNVMEDLRANSCDILTLGQYLSPSPSHYQVVDFINIEQFEKYRVIGAAMGFKSVLSGPLVRSSYQAEDVFKELNLSGNIR